MLAHRGIGFQPMIPCTSLKDAAREVVFAIRVRKAADFADPSNLVNGFLRP
jgi:hypothetical protein